MTSSQDAAGTSAAPTRVPLGCKVFGHDHGFTADRATMRWTCSRGCGVGGSKSYPGPSTAQHYARAFDRRDNRDVGRRAPLIGLVPLRLWRRIRTGRRS